MGDAMRILIHTSVPDAKRVIAASMDGLSGQPQEHSVECNAIHGGPSGAWDASHGYTGKWWAASQALAPEIASEMLTSGYVLGTESWFVAYYEDTGALIQHNLPNAPSDASFGAFLAAAGLARVIITMVGAN
jgi:hypothetical protein